MLLQRLFSRLLFTGLLLRSVAAIADPLPPINALWNAYNGFGIWLYSESGTCPDIRSKAKSFLVVSPGRQLSAGESINLTTKSLNLCSNWVNGHPEAECQSGTLELSYFELEHEYRGSFDFILSDGSSMKGTFRAQYCQYGI